MDVWIFLIRRYRRDCLARQGTSGDKNMRKWGGWWVEGETNEREVSRAGEFWSEVETWYKGNSYESQ